MANDGKDFEEAVAGIARALAPNARVTQRHHVQDRDTGAPREVDVWIEGTVGGHWPIRILVSCKDHRRKLDVGAIEKFHAELGSVTASCGVLYSRSGFSVNALRKAQSLGITCCQLLNNEPPPVPDVLSLRWHLVQSGRLRVDIEKAPAEIRTLEFWREVFRLVIAPGIDVASMVETRHREQEKLDVSNVQRDMVCPSGSEFGIELKTDAWSAPLRLTFGLRWRVFAGRVDAHRVKGSYCISTGKFRGSTSSPGIDTRGSHPGPGWEELLSPPVGRLGPGLVVMSSPSVAESLREWNSPVPWPSTE
jgi:hypothetical protein